MSKPLLSRVRRAGRVLYLSGIIGRGDTKESKFRDTFERIKGVLEENGLSLEDVVKATVYLEDKTQVPEPPMAGVLPRQPTDKNMRRGGTQRRPDRDNGRSHDTRLNHTHSIIHK